MAIVNLRTTVFSQFANPLLLKSTVILDEIIYDNFNIATISTGGLKMQTDVFPQLCHSSSLTHTASNTV